MPAAFSHVFRYDARGLVTGKGTPDGATRFAWSATGQLLRAAFHPAAAGEVTDAAAQVVTFQYDKQGQLTGCREQKQTGFLCRARRTECDNAFYCLSLYEIFE